jgi:hypothetical protein
MKKVILVTLILMGGLTAGVWGLRSFSYRFWERTLDGPFLGATFTGSMTNAPASVLAVPLHGQLEVHELKSMTNPVVVLRSADGTVRWSRVLIPEKKRTDGTLDRAGLRQLRLQSLERRNTNYVVLITCDWDWGGKEGGMIELDNNCGFNSFSLSW